MTEYEPTIDYEAAGYDNRSVVIGTIVPDESKPSIDRIADVSVVVDVRELITDEENVSIELVGGTRDVIERRSRNSRNWTSKSFEPRWSSDRSKIPSTDSGRGSGIGIWCDPRSTALF